MIRRDPSILAAVTARYEHALFQTEVESLTWDDAAHRWDLVTQRGDHIRTQFFISAGGPVHKAKLPGIDGRLGFDPVGRGGQRLSERWRDGTHSLHGVLTADFPNFKTCTPSYGDSEGARTMLAARGAVFPGSLMDYAAHLEQWRAEGSLAGTRVVRSD